MAKDGRDRALVEAMAVALRQGRLQSWRRMTPATVARQVVGAADHHAVSGLLLGVPGVAPAAGQADPADADDLRVTFLARRLGARRWRGRRLRTVCAELADDLATWQREREDFHAGLRRHGAR